jgi:hypothetical protein
MRRNSCANRRKVKVTEDAEEIYVTNIRNELFHMLDIKSKYSNSTHLPNRRAGNAIFTVTCMGSDKLLETAYNGVLNWQIGFNDLPYISSMAVLEAEVYRRPRYHDYIIKIDIGYVLNPEIKTPKPVRNLLK